MSYRWHFPIEACVRKILWKFSRGSLCKLRVNTGGTFLPLKTRSLARSCFYSIVGNPFQNIIIASFLISFGRYLRGSSVSEFMFLSVVFIHGYLCIKIVGASTRRRFYFDIDFLWKRQPLLRCALPAAIKFSHFFGYSTRT